MILERHVTLLTWRERIARAAHSREAFVVLLALIVAFGFLGARGIWDPDEGRYTNVALNMLDSGDWITPRRHHEVGHWTKPPMTYWAIASSVAVFGASPWSARLPSALSYLVCVLLVWKMAVRLAPGRQAAAATVYATMLFTVGASQFMTADYLLAAFATAAMWAFVEARFGDPAHGLRWLVLMWMSFAAAFLTKGPPGLMPLAVIIVFDQCMPGRDRFRLFRGMGVLLFAALALPWYVAVIRGHPGLLAYFVGEEVINRIATSEFSRHGRWYDWIWIYIPTLLLGTIPWTRWLLRWVKGLPKAVASWWRDPGRRAREAPQVLISLWIALPLLIFCVARSRMPLYLLPLFTPLALALALALRMPREWQVTASWRALGAWVLIMLLMKFAVAIWPTHKDASRWAEAIRARTSGPLREVIFVEDMARYGLHLHLGPHTEVEKIALAPYPQQAINPEYDDPLARELGEREANTLWICKQETFPEVRSRAMALGYQVEPLGEPFNGRVFFTAR
ncbi:glycosyltransferase family 39 protein [Lysobacter sp. S4-A87]|uniref:ArnT family glycosyltransferase n=1 Tax=Lysobacter sp. S4-A87 TaxID=2925843 RepID=UPI001F53ABAB|nr:glycosyltransferase family 39 protein [Lysobacter sp. S4-A87]UNK49813.1 glycosyltransferase family 39 protein [Lysobacter sp. S4-A87]